MQKLDALANKINENAELVFEDKAPEVTSNLNTYLTKILPCIATANLKTSSTDQILFNIRNIIKDNIDINNENNIDNNTANTEFTRQNIELLSNTVQLVDSNKDLNDEKPVFPNGFVNGTYFNNLNFRLGDARLRVWGLVIVFIGSIIGSLGDLIIKPFIIWWRY